MHITDNSFIVFTSREICTLPFPVLSLFFLSARLSLVVEYRILSSFFLQGTFSEKPYRNILLIPQHVYSSAWLPFVLVQVCTVRKDRLLRLNVLQVLSSRIRACSIVEGRGALHITDNSFTVFTSREICPPPPPPSCSLPLLPLCSFTSCH